MRKTKVLIENDLIDGGGVEIILRNLAKYLVARNCKVTVLALKGAKKSFYKLFPSNVKFITPHLPYRNVGKYSFVRILQRIRYELNRCKYYFYTHKQYDVAIALKEGPCMKSILSIQATKRFGWVHTDYNHLHWSAACFSAEESELQCMKRFDRIICVSNAVADSVRVTIGDPGNLTVIYNAIDIHTILYKATMVPSQKKSIGKPLFVTVGRLGKEKNHEMLISICERLLAEHDFEMWIIGEGPLQKKLEQLIPPTMTDKIRLLGKKENPYPYMKQADWFVCSSLTESFCLAIQEALILGVPVISTACPGIVETLDQRFGIISENSEEALEKALKSVLTNPALRNSYVENIRNHHSPEKLWEPRLEQICRLWEDKE